jgi:hypothetical protein
MSQQPESLQAIVQRAVDEHRTILETEGLARRAYPNLTEEELISAIERAQDEMIRRTYAELGAPVEADDGGLLGRYFAPQRIGPALREREQLLHAVMDSDAELSEVIRRYPAAVQLIIAEWSMLQHVTDPCREVPHLRPQLGGIKRHMASTLAQLSGSNLATFVDQAMGATGHEVPSALANLMPRSTVQ